MQRLKLTENSKGLIFFGLCLFFIYIGFLSKSYDFDTISLAQWAEDNLYFVPGQQFHLLNYVFNNIFFSLWKIFGYTGSAILPLQVLDSIFGVLSVTVFFLLVLKLSKSRFVSFVCSLGLAFSSEFWHYSTEAETHIISIFFLLLAVYVMARESPCYNAKVIFKSSLAFSLSVFSSSAYILFLPFFLLLIAFGENTAQEKKLFAWRYFFYVCLLWLLPFSLLGAAVSIKHCWHYLFDSGIIKFIKRFGVNFIYWFKSHEKYHIIKPSEVFFIAQNFTKMLFGYMKNPIAGLGLFFFSAAFVGINYDLIRRDKRLSSFAIASFLAFLIFISVFLVYEPFNTQRYTPLLVFFWLAASICMYITVKVFSWRWFQLFLLFLVAVNAYLNFSYRIYPLSQKENNFYLVETQCLKSHISAGDLVLIAGRDKFGYPEPRVRYFDYFGGIKFFELGYLNCRFNDKYRRDGTKQELLEFLRRKINSVLSAGYKVWVLGNVFSIKDKEKPKLSVRYITYDDILSFIKQNYNLSLKFTCRFNKFPAEKVYLVTR